MNSLDDFILSRVGEETLTIQISDFKNRWEFHIWSPSITDSHWRVRYRRMILGEHGKSKDFKTLDEVIEFMQNPNARQFAEYSHKQLSNFLNRAIERYPELEKLLDENDQ